MEHEHTASRSYNGVSLLRISSRCSLRRFFNDEDRKRGQRLFGGLLGTLSQSSSSAAQRRRADIEKKQQENPRGRVGFVSAEPFFVGGGDDGRRR
jgi:hypothetical protein